MKDTSRIAYETIQDNGLLSKSRWAVYAYLYDHPVITGNMLDRAFGNDSAHKRLSELEDRGVAEVVGEMVDPVTGMTNETWDVVRGELPVEPAATASGPSNVVTKKQIKAAVLELRWRGKDAAQTKEPFSEELQAVRRYLAHRCGMRTL